MLSVIICTHNPRTNYLSRVLDALKVQTLPKEQWELLLIDNASAEELSKIWDLAWHPNGQHIREEELGLTPARLCGIAQSRGDLLVFVDDDNVLSSSYLSDALELSAQYKHIGAFGGSITGEYEMPPPDWSLPYLNGLAICELDRDYWSNNLSFSSATPYGAGLCVHRNVAIDYANKVRFDPRRKSLDRRGTIMASGGDTDLVWCAIDLGMGSGRFKNLKLTHLIPRERLTKDYITQLFAGFIASDVILTAIRNSNLMSRESIVAEIFRFLRQYMRARGLGKKILVASWKAKRYARRLVGKDDR
jgi:glycosyltransferase involved in cell wall biosynthesis